MKITSPSKTIALLCLSLFVFVTATVSAQAAQSAKPKSGLEHAKILTPFHDETLRGVLHVDLRKIDFTAITEAALEDLEPMLLTYGLDEKSVARISKEAKKTILKGRDKLIAYQDVLVKECNVTDLYLITYYPVQEEGDLKGHAFFFIAVPTVGRTEKQQEAFKEYVEKWGAIELVGTPDWDEDDLPPRSTLDFKGFQLIESPEEDSIEHNMDFLKTLSGKMSFDLATPMEAAKDYAVKYVEVQTRLFGVGEDGEDEDFLGILTFSKLDEQTNEEFQQRCRELAKKIRGFTFALDLTNWSVVSTVKTESPTAAKECVTHLEKFIELLGEDVKLNMSEEQEEVRFLGPFFSEFTKGVLRTYAPSAEGDSLVKKLEIRQASLPLVSFYLGLARYLPDPKE